jgi:hypothetical protein
MRSARPAERVKAQAGEKAQLGRFHQTRFVVGRGGGILQGAAFAMEKAPLSRQTL